MAGPRSSSACAGLARRAVSESNHSRECTKPVSGAASRAAPASRAGAGAGGARVWPRAAGCERSRRTARSIAAPRVLHNRRPPGKHLVFDRDLRTTRSGPRWVSLEDKYSSAGCERRGSLGANKHFSSYQTASPRYLRFSITARALGQRSAFENWRNRTRTRTRTEPSSQLEPEPNRGFDLELKSNPNSNPNRTSTSTSATTV